ncbi:MULTISPECIES: type II toxin-antitoxin system RelE/ParE family toxin [Oceanobacillus]|uniref:Type II toxin-antitoxin system RelE/ParE family toxin n=1 Tax=Oceanobacillus aidingensis TaxID=645964 RepID=A0ABV9K1U7_9BACI
MWQLRLNNNRVLFFYFLEDNIVFTNQFKKKSNQTPENEIIRAENRRNDWINNHEL